MGKNCVKQYKFIFVNSGANLPEDHIVFTIKSVIKEFIKEYDFLFDEKKKVGKRRILMKNY